MKKKNVIVWAEIGADLVGVMPCGLTVAVLYISGGPALGGYHIRFGAAGTTETYWTVQAAKYAAMKMAKLILKDCIKTLEASMAEVEREKARFDEQQ